MNKISLHVDGEVVLNQRRAQITKYIKQVNDLLRTIKTDFDVWARTAIGVDFGDVNHQFTVDIAADTRIVLYGKPN